MKYKASFGKFDDSRVPLVWV